MKRIIIGGIESHRRCHRDSRKPSSPANRGITVPTELLNGTALKRYETLHVMSHNVTFMSHSENQVLLTDYSELGGGTQTSENRSS